MKRRLSFVTNSSSSSFVIIGTDSDEYIEELQAAENKREICCDYGIDYGDVVTFYGCYHNAHYVGIPAEALLETMTLPQAKQHFKQLVKQKLDVDIPEYAIELLYGEVGE